MEEYVLTERLLIVTEEKVSEEQVVFRKRKGCVYQIWYLQLRPRPLE